MNPLQILHQGENFLLAKLPQLEQGVVHLVSQAQGRVMLHRILSTGEILSQEMNVPLVRALLQAIDTAIPQ